MNTSHLDSILANKTPLYTIIDIQNGSPIMSKPDWNRKALRKKAERLDLAYGAYRYAVVEVQA